MQKLSALALGIAILGATGANAAPTFVLKNVQFTDGASIVGSFTTNDALTIVTNWNVTTGPGATSSFFDVPGTTTGASYAPAPIFFGVDFSTATLTSTAIKFVNNSLLGNTLTLDFSAPLSSAGTTIAGGFESIPFSLGRSVTGGAVIADATSAVPETATWSMMIVGMGAIGYALRRRRQVVMRVSYAA